jgi:hypothetical protein
MAVVQLSDHARSMFKDSQTNKLTLYPPQPAKQKMRAHVPKRRNEQTSKQKNNLLESKEKKIY